MIPAGVGVAKNTKSAIIQIKNFRMNKLLLTHLEVNEKYQELEKKKIATYFYKISKNSKYIYYIGTTHVFDPHDYQLKVIKKYWNEFIDETKKKNCVVLVEGGIRPVNKNDKEDVLIRRGGEAALTAYLAYKFNVECCSPEPGLDVEINHMLKHFSKEDTMYYYIVRVALQWNKLNSKPNFSEYITSFLNRYKKVTSWKDFDFSVENFIRLHNERHKHKFSERDEKCFYHDSNPMDSEVSRMSGDIRDEHILNEILKLWKKGKNIFIVFGSGHAIKQERALRSILN